MLLGGIGYGIRIVQVCTSFSSLGFIIWLFYHF
jgi:hypothetical protein